jgi:hypothetical protein
VNKSKHFSTELSIPSAVLYCCPLLFVFFLISIVGGGVQARSTRHVGHWMAYCTCPGWLWWWRNWWNEYWQERPKYSEKTYPSATLSTTNPTWPDPGSNPGRRGEKPATNRLSYGAAILFMFSSVLLKCVSLHCAYLCQHYTTFLCNTDCLHICMIPLLFCFTIPPSTLTSNVTLYSV